MLLRDAPSPQHVGTRIVDGIDRDQAAGAAVLNGEPPAAGLAVELGLIVSLHDPGDLKLQIVLVGPEPRNGVIRRAAAEDCRSRRLCMVDGILHAFEPQPPAASSN